MSVPRVRLELDSNVRRGSNGTALLGGSPFRLIRLSTAGAALLDRWVADGVGSEESDESAELRHRLIGAGMLHPVIEPARSAPVKKIAFVIPVYDDVDGLTELLVALRRHHPDGDVVVVDDASPRHGASLADIAHRHGAKLLRQPVNLGPAAARNLGWRSVVDAPDPPDTIAFVDADVVPTAGAFAALGVHFVDERVVAVAPRVRSRPGMTQIDDYEATASPLDMGTKRSLVGPRRAVSYVPSAALVVRADALVASAGFDEAMRSGEDVDFVWRLIADGGLVRYEPSAVVHHRNRSGLAELVSQRHTYGSAAAGLARRHQGQVAPAQLPAQIMASWFLGALAGKLGKLVGVAIALAGTRRLVGKLRDRVDWPMAEAVRLSATGHGHAGRWLASAVTRAWWPVLLPFSRGRQIVLASAVLAPFVQWTMRRPRVDPASYLVWRVVDDVAYSSGVWVGVLRERSLAAVLPRVNFEGNDDRR